MDLGTQLIASTPLVRLFLGFVFLLAAGSKVRDPRGFAAVVNALGFGRPRFRDSLRIGVPLVEGGLGAWLWTGWSPLGSAVTAVVVLVLLTLVLLKLRLSGYTGTCGCFVGNGDGASNLTIVRNVTLLLLALWLSLAAYTTPGATEPNRASWEWWSLQAVLALALVRTVALSRKAPLLVTSISDASNSPEEIGLRTELTDLCGARIVIGRPEGNAQLIVFAKGRCSGCLRDRDLLNRLPRGSSIPETVIICGGDLEETMEFAAEVKSPIRVVADPRWRTAIAWQVTTTPFSVLVDQDGRVKARGELASVLGLFGTADRISTAQP